MADRGVSELPRVRDAAKPAMTAHATAPDSQPAFDFTAILAISDALPVMIAYCDASLRYRFINRALAEWFERPRSDILGKSMREVLGEVAYPLREPMIRAALEGERQWFASDYDHPSRGSLAVQTEYIPQLASDGSVTGIIMLVEDITEQRLAGRALKESEARFRRIADSAPMPMWVTRLDRSRDFVNDAYAELMGVSREEALKSDWIARIHPDDRPRMIAETIAGERSGQSYAVEARFEYRPGDFRWMRGVSQPRHDSDGRLLGYIGVATDMTLVKEAEQQLRRQVDERTAALSASEARFRAIFDTVMEIIVLLTPDGTVVEVNRTEANWRHPAPRTSIGHKLWEAPTLEQYPQHVDRIRHAVAVAASGKIYTSEVEMARAGAPTAYLDVSMQPVRDESGEIVYLLFEARDITELKAAQEQLRQSQKMEALGQLTGGIAHDFNNLLTVVVGGLDLISKKVDDPKLKRYADNALSAAERGARLTAQLLAFSRVQKLEVRPTYVAPLIENMRPLLRNVLGPGDHEALRPRPRARSRSWPIRPSSSWPSSTSRSMRATRCRAEERSFSRTRPLVVSDDPEMADGDYVELAIRDTGMGMASDVAARAFEPFFTTKEVGKGTGLGLSMVYGVARQSGGTARIDSTPGEGTTVRLFFRRAESAAAVDQERVAEALAVPTRRAEILVIDDDPDVRAFIVASLDRTRPRGTRSRATGRAGWRCSRSSGPTWSSSTSSCPGCRAPRWRRPSSTTSPDQRLLFVSGYSETAAITRAAPDAPLLTKPFRADALDAAVREALD